MSTTTPPVYARIARELMPRLAAEAPERYPTVREVAAEFGVSIVTASRAIQMLKDGGFVIGERPAVEPECYAVCLHVTPGPQQPAAFQTTASGFRALARRTGLLFDLDAVRLDDTPPEAIPKRVRALTEAGVKGLILLPARLNDEAAARDEVLLSVCAEESLPVVLLERNLRGAERALDYDLVCFHDFAGGQALTRHLLGLGRLKIAFAAGSPSSSHLERLGGYLTALAGAGLAPIVVPAPERSSPRVAYSGIATRLIESGADAVICYHDYIAMGVIMELLRLGVRVPGDVAVAGFYGMAIGESFSIGVTTYSFPADQVAERAVEILRWRIAHPGATPMKVVLPGELIVRESTNAQMTDDD